MAGAESYEEEAQALDGVLKCFVGFTELAAVRCIIELGIPDIVENHPGGMTLEELSSALGCSAPSFIHRMMRFLTHRGIFKQVKMDGQDSPTAYAQTAFSRLLMKDNMAPLLLFLSNPELNASRMSLSKFLVSGNRDVGAFELANGADLWQYNAANPCFGELFNKGMACFAMLIVPAIIENCTTLFEGIGCLVDVGGGDGTTLRELVKACPWITRAINFDLPHVVSSCNGDDRVEYVGGDMFVSVPSADGVLMMSVLHDWDDEACVKILKNCRKAISKETGKVIIVDVVIDDESTNEYNDFQLALDIEILVHTIKGKERTAKEWGDLLISAGFTRYTIKHISSPKSVIEAYS